ncbi:hypothetical protein V1509DRAFT_369957 [Lipomyces kononenkoae]
MLAHPSALVLTRYFRLSLTRADYCGGGHGANYDGTLYLLKVLNLHWPGTHFRSLAYLTNRSMCFLFVPTQSFLDFFVHFKFTY